MEPFAYHQNILHVEEVPLPDLAAEHGTPVFVYSQAAITRNWQAFQQHLPAPHRAHYAVKANSNLAVLQLLARQGAGFDVVSGGEIARVLAAGGAPDKIVFSGVAKSVAEMEYALTEDVGQFNVESTAELRRLSEVAQLHGRIARVALRVNPDVDAQTHPYIATGLEDNKFGIPMAEAMSVYQLAAELPGIQVVGAACHIGSQLTDTAPFLAAMDRMLVLVDDLAAAGIELAHLDMGGGLGVCYQNEQPPAVADYLHQLLARLAPYPQLALYLEPGRAIVANAGLLLTRVEYLKHNGFKDFVIVDAGMNDLLRPSLYQAHHDIVNVVRGHSPAVAGDVVGPVCETGDFLGLERQLEAAAGDLLAVKSAGAYGFVMSSNYNTRVRPAEVLVHGRDAWLIRERESLRQLWQGEHLLP